jgi:hypothetical protein
MQHILRPPALAILRHEKYHRKKLTQIIQVSGAGTARTTTVRLTDQLRQQGWQASDLVVPSVWHVCQVTDPRWIMPKIPEVIASENPSRATNFYHLLLL